jgi:hypothetical protein
MRFLLTWNPAPEFASLASFLPARVWSSEASAVLAPGESTELGDADSLQLVAVIPGYEDLIVQVSAKQMGNPISLSAGEPDSLRPTPADLEYVTAPSRLSLDINPWAEGGSTHGSRRTTDLAIDRTENRLRISRHAGQAVEFELKLFSPRTPPRALAVPFPASCEPYSVAWHQPASAVIRPRVEPSDEGGRLLMEYILSERYDLAGASARRLETLRSGHDPLEWTVFSYTQLLIGYAHALNGDDIRLRCWCNRVRASHERGADALVLAAESAYRSGNTADSTALLERAIRAGLPTITAGAELGVRLMALLAIVNDEPESREVRGDWDQEDSDPEDRQALSNEMAAARAAWLGALTTTDADAATLSLPRSGAAAPDLMGSSNLRRAIGRIRYLVGAWRYQYTLSHSDSISHRLIDKGGAVDSATAQQPTAGPVSLKGVALWIAVIAIAIWLGFSIYLLVNAKSSSDLTWTRMAWVFGSIESVAFAAAGALFGTAIQREQTVKAEKRADSAESDAASTKELATKGQAFAAVVQADGMEAPGQAGPLAAKGVESSSTEVDDLKRRYSEISRSLFGDLVPRPGQ